MFSAGDPYDLDDTRRLGEGMLRVAGLTLLWGHRVTRSAVALSASVLEATSTRQSRAALGRLVAQRAVSLQRSPWHGFATHLTTCNTLAVRACQDVRTLRASRLSLPCPLTCTPKP